jgi:hypothetical protein
LPDQDPYTFDGLDRRANLLYFLGLGRPNADFATPGVLMVLLFAVGVAASLWRWRAPGATTITLWGAGVALYVVVQNALLQWHPWAFRYTILVAPWLAIVAAWLIESAPRGWRALLWLVTLASGGEILVEATFRADQVGWQAWQMPLHNAALAQGWRQWSEDLGADTPVLRIAQPGDRPLAWFFRLGPSISVHLESRAALPTTTAEAAVTGRTGWLVVPAKMYSGHEGQVMARTWLSRGNPEDDLSLAAYRALRPGENPAPVVYRNRTKPVSAGFRCDLALRSWQNSTRLEVVNPAESGWSYLIHSDAGETRGEVPVHGDIEVEVPTASDRLSELTVDFLPAPGTGDHGRPPVIMAVRPTGTGR